MIRRIARFQVVGLIGIGVQLATVWLLVHGGMRPLLATGLAVECAIVHNFAWHRLWTWRERTDVPVPTAFLRFQLTNGLVSLLGNVIMVAVLMRAFPMSATAANVIAIAVCAAANFASAEFFVFASRLRPTR
jgi:putative flippase GtrA